MWFDSVIGFFSPQTELKRIKARKAAEVIRTFDAAGRGRRWKNDRSSNLSANAENQKSLHTLRRRSRELVRNNPYAHKSIHSISSNVIGKGIMPVFNETDQELKDRWSQWAETTECDYDGNFDFYGLQSLFMKTICESGECLIRRRRVNRRRSSVGLQLQILEPDFINDRISLSSDQATLGRRLVQGIEFDKSDRKIAYHLFKNHPGSNGVDQKIAPGTFETIRVTAEDIIHGYRLDRPGQVRGVPWLHAVMLRLKELDEYEDAQLMRQKIAACYAGFIRDLDGNQELNADEVEEFEKFEPGMISRLPNGTTIEMANPPQVNESYDAYVSTVLHGVAAGLNMTYEELTGDLSKVNFSSARMGWLAYHRQIDTWRKNIILAQLCNPTYNWFREALNNVDGVESPRQINWTAPRREMIDPTKEVPANIKAVRAGLKTLGDCVREQGKHIQDHLREYKSDNDLIDSFGLVLDTDARNDLNEQQTTNEN